jgi:hypothetical protein
VEEFLWTREKGVLMEMRPNNDHRVRPHEVDQAVARDLHKMKRANDRIIVSPPNSFHT